MDLPWGDLVPTLALLLGGGFVMGVMAGLLGVGGGGLIVPVLYEVFGLAGIDEAIRMHMSVGTSLAIMIPTTLRSFRSHQKRGAVDLDIIRSMAVPIVVGVLIGAVAARFARAQELTLLWIVSAALMALKLYFGRPEWRLGKEIPGNPLRGLYAIAVGCLSTLMSIGGAAYITMMMTLYGRSMHQSIATSAGFGPMIAIPGAIGFVWAGWGVGGLPPASLGYVSLIGVAIVAPVSVLAAPLGVRIAHGISRRALELAFATFLALICLRFVLTLV